MLLVARRCPPESGHGCTCQRYFCRQGSLVFFLLSSALYKGGDLFPVFSHRLPRAPKSRSGYLLGSGERLESREHCEFRVSRHVFSDLSIFVSQLSKGLVFIYLLSGSWGDVVSLWGGDFFFFFFWLKSYLKFTQRRISGKRKHHILSLELNNPAFYEKKRT